jgi:hypothetical protein
MVHTESLNIQRAERGAEGNKVFVLSPPPFPLHTLVVLIGQIEITLLERKPSAYGLQLRIKQGSNESLGSGEKDIGHFCLKDLGNSFAENGTEYLPKIYYFLIQGTFLLPTFSYL